MPICLVDNGLDMLSSICDSMQAITCVSVVFFWVKTPSTHYQGAVLLIQWLFVFVSHDQPLKTLFIAPITDSKLMLNSDEHRFPSWVKFRECHNFYISLIVFDMQITLQNWAVRYCLITAWAGGKSLWSWCVLCISFHCK